MDPQQPERLRALWKSGRDKYRSFFAVLNEVRQEIGDDALPHWCLTELRIGMSVIIELSKVLRGADAATVKADLAEAQKVEQEQKRRARETRDAEHAETAIAREKKRAEIAKAKLEADKAESEAKRLAKIREKYAKKPQEKKDAANKRTAATRRKQRQAARDARPVPTDLNELAERIRRGHEQTERAEAAIAAGRQAWIDGSIALATGLAAARAAFPADQEFGKWLAESELDFYGHTDRAALIAMGRDAAQMREILNKTESRSYRQIWRDHSVSPNGETGNVIQFQGSK